MSGCTLLADVAVQMRRAHWFDYVRQRFDLVSLGSVADWFSRRESSFERDPELKRQVLRELESAIADGDFGDASQRKRTFVWLPKPPPADNLGHMCLRLNFGQIAYYNGAITPDIYLPRTLLAQWLAVRGMKSPPFIANGRPVTIEGTAEAAASRQIDGLDAAQKPARVRRDIKRTDYSPADEGLLTDMRKLRTSSPPKATSDWDAAVQVSAKAAGNATPISKAQRLHGKYRKRYPEEGS